MIETSADLYSSTTDKGGPTFYVHISTRQGPLTTVIRHELSDRERKAWAQRLLGIPMETLNFT